MKKRQRIKSDNKKRRNTNTYIEMKRQMSLDIAIMIVKNDGDCPSLSSAQLTMKLSNGIINLRNAGVLCRYCPVVDVCLYRSPDTTNNINEHRNKEALHYLLNIRKMDIGVLTGELL